MGGGCGMHWYNRTASEIWQGSLKEHNYLQKLGMDGRVIIQDRQCMYNVTFQVCLCNHCCSGQAIRITYSECVSVGLGIRPAVLMHHIGYLWPVRLYSIFLHYLINGMNFEEKKKLLNVKCVFWFYLQFFFWNICHSWKNWLRCDQKFILFFMYSTVPIIFVRF
jgi:hypothetical protein